MAASVKSFNPIQHIAIINKSAEIVDKNFESIRKSRHNAIQEISFESEGDFVCQLACMLLTAINSFDEVLIAMDRQGITDNIENFLDDALGDIEKWVIEICFIGSGGMTTSPLEHCLIWNEFSIFYREDTRVLAYKNNPFQGVSEFMKDQAMNYFLRSYSP